ncbi:keratinocyte proline-rich protein-like [Hylobates moloch]|uniref:keratinocyte proline-rich protein-like n=1 Tax=Hylobates moloch TaxID=81572 RepID=UPI0026767807|nr:keratinocyte proline-rich protein-like [Hylobates moloch]
MLQCLEAVEQNNPRLLAQIDASMGWGLATLPRLVPTAGLKSSARLHLPKRRDRRCELPRPAQSFRLLAGIIFTSKLFYTRTKRQTKSLLHHCLSRVTARDIFSKRLPGPARSWSAREDPGQRAFPAAPEVAVTPGPVPDRGGSGAALRGLPLPQAPRPLAAYSYRRGPGRGAARPELPVERLPEVRAGTAPAPPASAAAAPDPCPDPAADPDPDPCPNRRGRPRSLTASPRPPPSPAGSPAASPVPCPPHHLPGPQRPPPSPAPTPAADPDPRGRPRPLPRPKRPPPSPAGSPAVSPVPCPVCCGRPCLLPAPCPVRPGLPKVQSAPLQTRGRGHRLL